MLAEDSGLGPSTSEGVREPTLLDANLVEANLRVAKPSALVASQRSNAAR
jgi:hypothetical protein